MSGFLDGLPSRGLLVSVQPGAAFTAAPNPFIADYDTAPPPNQVIKTDPTSLLIRTLQNRKAREEAKRKQKAGKRPADGAAGGARQPKRAAPSAAPAPAAAGGGDEAGPSTTAAPVLPPPAEATYDRATLQQRTVKDLQVVLKGWGLTVTGKKDDLIARILDKQGH